MQDVDQDGKPNLEIWGAQILHNLVQGTQVSE